MNTPTNPTDHDLNIRLTHEAEAFFSRGGTALEIGQVLDRAGEIKRGRRMRATMLMAACVLAIAVPTALVATRGHHDKPATPATPTKVDTSPLTLKGLERGTQPHDGYATDGRYHVGNGTIDLSAGKETVGAVARVDGGVMVYLRNQEGRDNTYFVDDQGATTGPAYRMDDGGDFAVSADGHRVAFVSPDGTPIVVQDNDTTAFELMRIPRGSGFDAVAITGDDCRSQPGNTGCAVWVQNNGEKPGSWMSTKTAVSTARTEFRKIADVYDERVAGIIEVHDDLTTCSAVEAPAVHEPGWKTCDNHMVAFSPDGSHVLAQPEGDGLGPVGLAVYDADDGKVLLDLEVADQGYIRQMVWEDDSHVLATIYQNGQWAVVRIGFNGSREYALPPVTATDDVEPPFVLPSS